MPLYYRTREKKQDSLLTKITACGINCVETRDATPTEETEMRYEIHFYKTENLNPDERNAARRGAAGLWLYAIDVDAESPRAAIAAARKLQSSRGILGAGCKLRAKRA